MNGLRVFTKRKHLQLHLQDRNSTRIATLPFKQILLVLVYIAYIQALSLDKQTDPRKPGTKQRTTPMTSQEIFTTALQYETKIRDLYLSADSIIDDERGKAIFRALADGPFSLQAMNLHPQFSCRPTNIG